MQNPENSETPKDKLEHVTKSQIDLITSIESIENVDDFNKENSSINVKQNDPNVDVNYDEYEILNKNDENENTNDINLDNAKLEESNDFTKITSTNNEFEIEKNDENLFTDILGNGTLTKTIINKGIDGKRPKTGQICTISYVTKLENGNEVENVKDFQFILGDGDVIAAFDIAICLMNLNEESEIVTDSRHAYGEKGSLPTIPENSKLIYKLKLENFIDPPDLNTLNPIERLSLAEAKKTRGNYYYNRQQFDTAINSYKKGLKYFYDQNLSNNENNEDLERFLEIKIILLMNVALSNYKLQLYNEALESLDEVLKNQSKHLKALFIKGKILMHLDELYESMKFFTKALEIDPNNLDIKKELSKAQAKYKIQYDKEKKLYQKMIAGVASASEKDSDNDDDNDANKKTNDKTFNSFFKFSYLAATGIIIAVASIGIAAYVKYKNSF